MSESDDRRPAAEQEFKLSVEVPEHVRQDPAALRRFLKKMSRDLLNADQIQFREAHHQGPDEGLDEGLDEGAVAGGPSAGGAGGAGGGGGGGGGGDRVSVTMLVRPCGGRFLTADVGDPEGEADDGAPGEVGSDVDGGAQP
jgi:hypothetical protein